MLTDQFWAILVGSNFDVTNIEEYRKGGIFQQFWPWLQIQNLWEFIEK